MSGVYIKGIEMPKNCCICHFSSHDMCLLCKRDAEDWFENRPEYCPLVEVPDHGDLIDRDELKEPVGSYLPLKWTYEYGHIITWEDIITAPAIIPADKEDHDETS